MQHSELSRWGILPMRVLVGYGLMEHGFAKLSRGPDAFAGILEHLGVPMPHLAAWVTIGTELSWRSGSVAWSFCDLGKHSHGLYAACCNDHRPPAIRIQFCEATEYFRFRRGVRPGGL